MSDFKHTPPQTGFSTGALEKGNYASALNWLTNNDIDTVELSALRFSELKPMINELNSLRVDNFKYISFHAPSSFEPEQEGEVVEMLQEVYKKGWNIIAHPDVIYTPKYWKPFKEQLLIENMDRRKRVGRTTSELRDIFELLPSARMCLDVAHARQIDTTLTLLSSLFHHYSHKIAEIHISELDSRCRHLTMSNQAVKDYQSLKWFKNLQVPVIIESMLDSLDESQRMQEFTSTREVFRNSHQMTNTI